MNTVQNMTVRAMFLVSTGIVLLLHVLGIVKEGIAVFLTFLSIFVILYGLSVLGFWGFVTRMFHRGYSWIARERKEHASATKTRHAAHRGASHGARRTGARRKKAAVAPAVMLAGPKTAKRSASRRKTSKTSARRGVKKS